MRNKIVRLGGTLLVAAMACGLAGAAAAMDDPPAGFSAPAAENLRGRVEEFAYDSGVTGRRRLANVYLPPGYTAERRYPVLYLLHGIAGNHHEWAGYVHADAVLDRLIAAGQAVPMIVVMPNGRALADDAPPPQERMFKPEHFAGFAAFERDLLDYLIPAVQARYAVQGDAAHRAIAGLSMGGGQALNFGLAHPELFSAVAGFSAAPNARLPEQLASGQLPRTPALLYLSCGTQEGLFQRLQDTHLLLQKHGVPHVWGTDDHGHDRESWAIHLYHFARLVFRPPAQPAAQAGASSAR